MHVEDCNCTHVSCICANANSDSIFLGLGDSGLLLTCWTLRILYYSKVVGGGARTNR